MKFRILVLSCYTIIYTSNICYSQFSWYQTNGPMGGVILDQLYYNGKLFSGTDAGIFISLDDGNTFSRWGLQDKVISAIAADSSGYLYVGTWDSKMYKTSINDNYWELLDFPFSGSIIDLQYHPDGYIFVATRLAGIFISSDSGISWHDVNAGLPSTFVTSILITQSREIFIGLDHNGVYKSENLGTSWINKSAGIYNRRVFALMEDLNGNLFAGLYLGSPYLGGIYISSNRGESWTYNAIEYMNVYFLFCDYDGILYCGGTNGFFRSTNAGSLWQQVGQGLSIPSFNSMSSNSQGSIFVGGYFGLYKSTNTGSNFIRVGFPVIPVFCFTLHPNGNILAGTDYGVYRSSDYGQSWLTFNNGLTESYIYRLLNSQSGAIIAATEDFGIFRLNTATNGWNWVMQEFEDIYDLTQDDNGNIFAVSSDSIYFSSDDGVHWSTINSSPVNNTIHTITVFNNYLFVGTDGGVFITTDQGISWAQNNNGLENLDIHYLLNVNDNSVYAATQNGVYRYINDVWENINTPISMQNFNHLFYFDETIYAASDSGVFYYKIRQNEWFSANDGLEDKYVLSIGIDDAGFLLAGTKKGSCYRTNISLNINETFNTNFTNYFLFQNYPNPFNPTTKIKFTIPDSPLSFGEGQGVRLVVYDVLGNEITTLINKELPAGEYEVEFNTNSVEGRKLTSGVYFYQLRVGGPEINSGQGFIQTKKMILLK